MKKIIGLILCLSLVILTSGCTADELSSLAGIAGVNISTDSVNSLIQDVTDLMSKYENQITIQSPSKPGS